MRASDIDPPLTVIIPFDQLQAVMGAQAEVAYVRIREVGNRERVITDDACFPVRLYVAEPLDSGRMTPAQDGLVRFHSPSWAPALTPGDELIMTLWWVEATASYHEMNRYRLRIRDGHLASPPPSDFPWPPLSTGDTVDHILRTFRSELRATPRP